MALEFVAVGEDLVLVGDDNVVVGHAISNELQEIIDYYTNLLIIQYHEKIKAKATIQALITALLADGLILDVDRAFDLDTAVGAQLDTIGKYVGVDRFYNVTDPIDYFALTPYDEVDPETHDKYGFSLYSSFPSGVGNGTVTYNTIVTIGNRLNDDDYRILLKLKIARNYSNHSHKSINDILFEFFASDVYADSPNDMTMTFNITPDAPLGIIQAAIQKNILPRPMGVSATINML